MMYFVKVQDTYEALVAIVDALACITTQRLSPADQLVLDVALIEAHRVLDNWGLDGEEPSDYTVEDLRVGQG